MRTTIEIAAVLRDLRVRLPARASAVVSRDGVVQGADLPVPESTETYGVLCATVLGAAAMALRGVGQAPPARIVIEGGDSRTYIVPSGGNALLAVVSDLSLDPSAAWEIITPFAEFLAAAEGPTAAPLG